MNLRNGKITGTVVSDNNSSNGVLLDNLRGSNEAFFRKIPGYLSHIEIDLKSLVINMQLELDKMNNDLLCDIETKFKGCIKIYKMIRKHLYLIKIINGKLMEILLGKNDHLIEEATIFIRDNPTNQIVISYAEELIDIVNDVKYMLTF